MRKLLYPVAFLVSWNHWLHGHIASKVMEWFDGWWFDFWFHHYQFNMDISSDAQDFVGGKGGWWPWGEAVVFQEENHEE